MPRRVGYPSKPAMADPEPHDGQGAYSTEQLWQMDAAFVGAVESAIARGLEQVFCEDVAPDYAARAHAAGFPSRLTLMAALDTTHSTALPSPNEILSS